MGALRLALSQFGAELGDVGANRRRMGAALEVAAANGADLVCFPELALSGYLLAAGDYDDALLTAVEEADDSLASRCQELGVTAVYGAPRRDREGWLRNAVILRGPGGCRVVYDKTHMVESERRVFAPGHEPVVIVAQSIGLTCCYDLAFPEAIRTLTLSGARLVVVPMAWEVERAFVMRSVRAARAVENIAFVALVNQSGSLGGLRFAGDSCVIDPLGQTRVSAGEDERLVLCDLDLDWVDRLRSGDDARTYPLLADRRTELYGDLVSRACSHDDHSVSSQTATRGRGRLLPASRS